MAQVAQSRHNQNRSTIDQLVRNLTTALTQTLRTRLSMNALCHKVRVIQRADGPDHERVLAVLQADSNPTEYGAASIPAKAIPDYSIVCVL